jgi:hypothetical protein
MKNKIIGLLFLWVTCPGIANERPLPQGFSFAAGALPQIQFAQGSSPGIGFFIQPGYQLSNFVFSLELMHVEPKANYRYTYAGLNITYSMFIESLNLYFHPLALGIKAANVYEDIDRSDTVVDIKNKTALSISVATGLAIPIDQNIAVIIEPGFMYHQFLDSSNSGTEDRSNAMLKLGLRYSMDDLIPIAY